MKYLKITFFIATIIILFIGCNSLKKQEREEMKRREELDKIKEQRIREDEKAYEEALKRHYQMQSKSTKKAMKKAQKEAKRYNNNIVKKDFFIKRWLSKQQKKKKDA
ncbi:MAG TPA: hypothetical protein P5250_08150, partial [Bacteroidales bacterium]|nr:hypothetical protein [Bacteroidales bacterium]